MSFSRSDAVGSAQYDVYTADLSGNSLVNVTATAAGGSTSSDFQSSFSPTSSQLVFASNAGGDREIWKSGTDGSVPVQLTSNTASDSNPDWGPATQPAVVPPAPTVTSTVPSAGAATVGFVSNGNGGSPITSYSVACFSTDGGVARKASGAASPVKVSSLSDGKSYRCKVRAVNAVGTGAYSAYGATVKIGAAVVPPAPSVTSTVPSAGAATVGFVSNGNGGSPITSYAVACFSTDGGVARKASGAASPVKVSSLSAGKSYRCKVRAVNAVGTGAYSAYGATVTIAAAVVPPAPSVTSTVPSAGAATVGFVSNGNGGSPITSYSVACFSTDGGVARNASGAASPVKVSGLSAAKSYRCKVRAVNAVGAGAYSAYGASVLIPTS